MGRYCTYLLPEQRGRISQIQVNKTQSTRTWDALYNIITKAINGLCKADIKTRDNFDQLQISAMLECPWAAGHKGLKTLLVLRRMLRSYACRPRQNLHGLHDALYRHR